jgi:hypothetical protein
MTTTTSLSDEVVRSAAQELISRRGPAAKDEAIARVAAFEQQGNWPEHALAMRVLSAVERLLDPNAT